VQEVLLNRGCNSDCQYCGLQVAYRGAFKGRQRFWRSREPKAIVDEIEYFIEIYGVQRFIFNAFVFFGYSLEGREILERVLREILRRKLDIQFSFVTHPDKLHPNMQLLPLLKEAGLQSLYLGIDSGLARALHLYQVDFRVIDIFAALKILHESNIRFDVGFFFFDPYIEFDEIPVHLEFLRSIRIYFEHMEKPFSFYLDQQLLTSALRVNWGMPICRKLDEDGLLVHGADPLERDPAVRFQDHKAGRFFAAHQFILQTEEMKSLRRAFLGETLVRDLDLLPLRVAEHLWEILARENDLPLPPVVEIMKSWLRSQPEWARIKTTTRSGANQALPEATSSWDGRERCLE
jgi:hypothetical protein